MKKILIIEDNESIAELERDYLEANGFAIEIVDNGTEGLKRALADDVDLLLLDIMLPGVDGFKICREVRKKRDIPILIVSARREDIDKVRGLRLGADDYISKPFSPNELVARVKAHLSRYEQLRGSTGQTALVKSLQFDFLEIQPETRRVFREGKEISLTHKEFDLLLFLASSPGIVFSKEKIFEEVWGWDAAGGTATVMVHVNRLREKIEENPQKPHYIETVWGVGYRFCSKK